MAHDMKLPKWVKAYQRRGVWFYYFRRRGFKPVRVPGEQWSEPFMAAYALALAGGAPSPLCGRRPCRLRQHGSGDPHLSRLDGRQEYSTRSRARRPSACIGVCSSG